MPRPRLRRMLAMLGLLAVIALWTAPRAAADTPAFTIAADGVTTATGLAADSATSTYWVTGATGSQGAVYALSSTGQDKGSIGFRADVQSVQALAYHDGRLYVGDVGDAKHQRDHITVYYFDNVTPDAGVITYHAWDFRYPDGPQDAKAMVVDDSGHLYLITTGDHAGIYAAPDQPSRRGVNDLKRVGDAPADDITDAVALGADRWAVRTKDTVDVVDASSYKVTASASLPTKDGEALGTELSDPSTLLAAGTGSSASVFSLSVPTTIAKSPSPSPTPTTSSSPSASSEPDETSVQGPEVTGAGRRTGTWVAVGAAALLALLGGAAAYFLTGRGRPVADDDSTQEREGAAVTSVQEAEPAAQDGSGPSMDAAGAGGVAAEPYLPIAPIPASGIPAALQGSPQTPARPDAYQPARESGTPTSGTESAPRRAREPGDIEDDDDAPVELSGDDLDETVLRDRLPGRHAEGPGNNG